ncbi:HIT domain-containing protein [Thiolinea disciformis]|uniref:HIT domain-containing protein n=1 Tax=Thiolinea disciformis TaxID=125614 RepID=UPI00036072F7|nr:HIT domain-containing protein [Thiolinea disciformis]
MSFELHAQLAADCFVVGDLELCRLLLMNDSHYPWFILVPRRAGIREIIELSEDERRQLWQESDWLSRELMRHFQPDKLNIAALGNMVPQLHLHHIARFKSDAAWPAPVWGKHPAQAYTPEQAQDRIQAMQAAFKL